MADRTDIRTAEHDPGAATAAARAPAPEPVQPQRVGHALVRVGTAGWTDRTLTARGVFYPSGVSTPEARLRYYATRFSMVEADAGFYALPDRATTERWVERTPPDFVFDVKAHALMTGHATDVARLPASVRELLPASVGLRAYARNLPIEVRDEVWRLFRDAVTPLHEAGKLGAVLLQFAPWIKPSRSTPAMFARARDRLGTLPIAVEFRNPAWLAPRIRQRVWDELRANELTYVVADTPPGTPTSMPRVAAVTTPRLSVVRMHGRRSELWGAREATVAEKYRYLYDRGEIEDWLSTVLELAEEVEQLHIVFNNCYANYGTTNALEMAGLVADAAATPP